jgi:hypothetical protein
VRYKKSLEALGMSNTITNLNHADTVIWKAFQNICMVLTFISNFVGLISDLDHCDGRISSELGYALPVFHAQKLVDIIEDHHSSQTSYDQLGYEDTPVQDLRLLPPGGFIIKDADGIPLVAHFPDIYRKAQVVSQSLILKFFVS